MALWELPNGKPQLFGKPGALRGNIVASPDGKYLATCGHPGDPQLCDAAGKQLRTLPGASELTFAPDSKTLAIRKGERLTFLDLPDLTMRPAPEGMEPELLDALAYSTDGRTLALGARHRPWTFRLWDMIEQKELRTLTDMGHDLNSVQFSRDGRLLITTSTYDSNTRVSDAMTGKAIHRLPGVSPALSPDGKTIATGGNGTVRLFDLESGREERAIVIGPPSGTIRQICYTPEGRHLVTVNGNGTLYILRLAPAP